MKALSSLVFSLTLICVSTAANANSPSDYKCDVVSVADGQTKRLPQVASAGGSFEAKDQENGWIVLVNFTTPDPMLGSITILDVKSTTGTTLQFSEAAPTFHYASYRSGKNAVTLYCSKQN